MVLSSISNLSHLIKAIIQLLVLTFISRWLYVLQRVVRGFYRLFPVPSFLDYLYLRSKLLQKVFSFHLNYVEDGNIASKQSSLCFQLPFTLLYIELPSKDKLFHIFQAKHSLQSYSSSADIVILGDIFESKERLTPDQIHLLLSLTADGSSVWVLSLTHVFDASHSLKSMNYAASKIHLLNESRNKHYLFLATSLYCNVLYQWHKQPNKSLQTHQIVYISPIIYSLVGNNSEIGQYVRNRFVFSILSILYSLGKWNELSAYNHILSAECSGLLFRAMLNQLSYVAQDDHLDGKVLVRECNTSTVLLDAFTRYLLTDSTIAKNAYAAARDICKKDESLIYIASNKASKYDNIRGVRTIEAMGNDFDLLSLNCLQSIIQLNKR